jgi:LuxR family maltose regulon positive regulatory protein
MPHVRAESVVRTALVNRLRASRAPLAVVRAPAGYGKTTALAQWAAREPRPVAWLQLDEGANDLAVLLRRLGLALRHLPPQVIQAEAADSRRQSAPTAIGRLFGAVRAAGRPFVLVLDDTHVLRSRGSLAAVATLAAEMPEGSTLALAGRSVRIAVARARAAGRLFELGADDLALSRREEELLLRQAGVALDPAEHQALRQRMEGWAAGTYLAALALREGSPTVGSGEDRFVADYFDFECASRLSTRDLEFLFRTSVLERLSGSLCDHVLEAEGSAARLESLTRSNLFVRPLDRERCWYRCHHAFREYLLAELRRREPRLIPELERRAATWCEANGEIAAAAEHAHAGGDLDHVARLVTGEGLNSSTARSAIGESWLRWFDRAEHLRSRPDVAVLGTWTHLVHGRPAEARRWRNAAAGAACSPTAELAVLQAARCENGVERMRADAQTAVAALGPVSHWQPVALLLAGVAELLLGEVAHAEETLADAAEAAESAGATEIEVWALSELALAAWGSDDEARAHQRALEACSRVEERELHADPCSALAFAAVARLHLRRGETASARLAYGFADSLVPQLTHALPWHAVQTLLELARVELALADPAAALRRVELAKAVLRRRPRLGDLVAQAQGLTAEVQALAGRRDGRRSGLTAAELRLLPLLTTHLSFREIAAELYVSRNTVKTQAISVYRKLDASSRSEAIARARDLGLVDPAAPRAEFTLSG